MSGSSSLYLGYDGTERRVYKKETVNSVNQEQIYLHDGMHAIIERQKSGQTTEYIMGPTGIIAVRTNGAECYIIKDHLGSTRVVVDKTGTVQSGYEYSSFGTLISSTGTNGINYRFTGQEYDEITGLHNFKARMYDGDMALFYGTDPLSQFSSSFTYSGNNPVLMVDKDGKFAFIPILIGAAIGGYSGYKIGKYSNAKGLEMLGYIAGGALIGGFSGFVGSEIAASGTLFAQTTALAVSSYTNSMGMNMLSQGQTDVSISFGVASYNLSNGDLGYLGKKGNSTLDNIGYGLGALSNIADLNRAINTTHATLYTEKGDPISHSAITDESGKPLMSYGPNDNKMDDGIKTDIINTKKGIMRDATSYKKFGLAIRKSTSDYHVYKDMPVNVTLNKYSVNIVRGLGKILPYQGATTNCSNMASLSLWVNGIPNIGIHPYLLYASTKAYTLGVRPDLFSYHLLNR